MQTIKSHPNRCPPKWTISWQKFPSQNCWLSLTITSTYRPVKFFKNTQRFFKFPSDCTPGYFAEPNIYPRGRLLISSAALASLSYWSGGITLNSLQSLGCNADDTEIIKKKKKRKNWWKIMHFLSTVFIRLTVLGVTCHKGGHLFFSQHF